MSWIGRRAVRYQPVRQRFETMGRNVKIWVRRLVRNVSLWIVTSRAAPAPIIEPGSRLVVVAPHPDDETLGCGALLARLSANGHSPTVVFLTDGELGPAGPSARLGAARRAEAIAACSRLGIEEAGLRFLGLADGSLDDQREALRAALLPLIGNSGVDVVLVTSQTDRHTDHQAAAEVVRALQEQGSFHLWEYPVWTWRHWPWIDPGPLRLTDAFRATFTLKVHRVRAGAHMEQKKGALAEYRSQTDERSQAEGGRVLPPDLLRLATRPYELYFVDRGTELDAVAADGRRS